VDRSSNANKAKGLPKIDHNSLNKSEKLARKKVYEALKRAQEVYNERYTFNTMIAGVMEAMNALSDQNNRDVYTEGYWILSSIMEPIIPHVCWEISHELFGGVNLCEQVVLDEVFEVDALMLGVSVNGKNSGTIEVDVCLGDDEIIDIAKKSVDKWLEGKEIVKAIVVQGKLVNLVIKG
jgi:leucyl-tRNA synthetase